MMLLLNEIIINLCLQDFLFILSENCFIYLSVLVSSFKFFCSSVSGVIEIK